MNITIPQETLEDTIQMLRDIANGKSWPSLEYWDRIVALEITLKEALKKNAPLDV